MNQSQPVIVLTGGGSGGHVTPILSVARELKRQKPGCEVVYIGHKGDNFDSLKASPGYIDFLTFLNGGKFRRYHGESVLSHLLDIKTLLLNSRDFFRVISATISAYKLLSKFKPDVVFSKGGFVAVPVGLAARLRGIPIVTHDSDSMPGLANRIIGRWARIHATGMPAEYYPYPKSKTVYVGIPLADEIKEVAPADQAKYKRKLGLNKGARLLLVAGGGNGSMKLNELTTAVANELLRNFTDLNIVVIAGTKHAKLLSEQCKAMLDPANLKRVIILDFVKNFYEFSGAADLIVGRAGATSLSEYEEQAKACIIIPSPFLAGGHQLKNAEVLTANDAAVVMPNDTSPDELEAVISELLSDPDRRAHLGRNMHKLAKPGASQELAKIILRVASTGAKVDTI